MHVPLHASTVAPDSILNVGVVPCSPISVTVPEIVTFAIAVVGAAFVEHVKSYIGGASTGASIGSASGASIAASTGLLLLLPHAASATTRHTRTLIMLRRTPCVS